MRIKNSLCLNLNKTKVYFKPYSFKSRDKWTDRQIPAQIAKRFITMLLLPLPENRVSKHFCKYTGVSFLDSKGFRKSRCIKKVRINKKRSHRRNNLKTSLTYNTRAQNEKSIQNLSNKVLSYNEVRLFSRGLKFIPTPPVHSVPSSNI